MKNLCEKLFSWVLTFQKNGDSMGDKKRALIRKFGFRSFQKRAVATG
jgi:hypothetical protein